jgi:hypothetical protein
MQPTCSGRASFDAHDPERSFDPPVDARLFSRKLKSEERNPLTLLFRAAA